MRIFSYHGSEDDWRRRSNMTGKYQFHTFVVQQAILLQATISVAPNFSLTPSWFLVCVLRTTHADFRVSGLLADGGRRERSGRFLPW